MMFESTCPFGSAASIARNGRSVHAPNVQAPSVRVRIADATTVNPQAARGRLATSLPAEEPRPRSARVRFAGIPTEPLRSVWRADDAEAMAPKGKVPRRGADPKAARAENADKPRKRAADVTDRKGRAVQVERVPRDPSHDFKFAPREEAAAKRSLWTEDSANELTPRERPARARPQGERTRTTGERSERPRPSGDRPFKPRGDRPRAGATDGDRPRTGRFDGERPARARSDRPDGERSFKPRGDRPEGDRPFKPRGDRPQGDRPQGDRPPRSGKPSGPSAASLLRVAGLRPVASLRSVASLAVTVRVRRAVVPVGRVVAVRARPAASRVVPAGPAADARVLPGSVELRHADRRGPVQGTAVDRAEVVRREADVRSAARDDLQHSRARL